MTAAAHRRLPGDPTGFAAARAICRRHARSFYFASHFLPEPKRDAAYAVYAFCRLLDDAIDEAATDAEREAGLAHFERVLDACYGGGVEGEAPPGLAGAPAAGRPEVPGWRLFLARHFAHVHVDGVDRSWPPRRDPVDERRLALAAFAHTARACAIPKQHFLDLAHGCRMDLTVTRYATWPDLERYCYHVAGVVGLIMCRVFDLTDPTVLGHAVHMGNAMQLTNVLRDVGEDWRRGRLYLPLDEAYDGIEADVAERRVTPRFEGVMRRQVARARAMYREASEGLLAIPDDGSRMTACVMAVVYGGILGAIERNGYDTLTRRARLSGWQKVARLPKARRLARRRAGEPVPDVF